MTKQTEALKMAISVISSINQGKQHFIVIDDDRGFFQRAEWVRWAIDEVLPQIKEALERPTNMVAVPADQLEKMQQELKQLRDEHKKWQGFARRVS